MSILGPMIRISITAAAFEARFAASSGMYLMGNAEWRPSPRS